MTAPSLARRVAVMEDRMGMGQQPTQIFVYRGLAETEDEALARHFEGKGAPAGVEVVMYGFTPLEGAEK